MNGQWREVVRLTFKGQRFRDHALDLSAITELRRFQKMVTETAKAIWRAANPGRDRLPRRFEERTRLCLRKIEEGSAVAPLEVFMEEPAQRELFDREPTEINEAINLAKQVLRAAERDEQFPENFPRSLVPEYERCGQELMDDEEIEVSTDGEEPVRVTPTTRTRLSALSESSHEDHVDITGEVLEADIRLRRSQVWLDEKTYVTVSFSPEQENQITNALRNHQTLRLQVIGRGEFSPQGKPLRVTQVEKLLLQPVGDVPFDTTAAPIEEALVELANKVPQKEWDRLPDDLTDNLDHYIYGTPKR